MVALARLTHLGETSDPIGSSKLKGQASLFLAGDQFFQGPPENLARGPSAGELAGPGKQMGVDNHVGAFHTPFVRHDGGDRQPPDRSQDQKAAWMRPEKIETGPRSAL